MHHTQQDFPSGDLFNSFHTNRCIPNSLNSTNLISSKNERKQLPNIIRIVSPQNSSLNKIIWATTASGNGL